MMNNKPTDIDAYIETFPVSTQKILNQVRKIIHKAVPEAEEVISYSMPAYRYHGMMVYFAGYKNHIGFYPSGSGITAFKEELSPFKWSKGAIQFPIDQPMPVDLITRISKFRAAENLEKDRLKKSTSKVSKKRTTPKH